MADFMQRLLGADFLPRALLSLAAGAGRCVVSDALIALAYFAIQPPSSTSSKRSDVLPFLFVCSGAFIIACGTTHVIGVDLWYPTYWLRRREGRRR
jgi:hypothetical protein